MSDPTLSKTDLSPLLLVEDNPDHALLSREELESGGLQNPIHLAENFRDSASYLKEAAAPDRREGCKLPCLVLLDVWLPDASGLDLLPMMKAHPVLQGIPVIVLSTAHDQLTINSAYRLGVTHYLTKPLDLGELRALTQDCGLEWKA
jgi:two-component system response regulator